MKKVIMMTLFLGVFAQTANAGQKEKAEAYARSNPEQTEAEAHKIESFAKENPTKAYADADKIENVRSNMGQGPERLYQ